MLTDAGSQPQDLPSPGDSVVLEQLSRLNNEMQRALNQCEAVESEMTALMDENLTIRRDRDAAVEMARSLLSQVRAAEVERSKSVEEMKELAKQLEDMREENEQLKEELAQRQIVCTDASVNTDSLIVCASNDQLPAEANDSNDDLAYTDDDLNNAFDSLDEEGIKSHEQMDQPKSRVGAEEASREAMNKPFEQTGTENQTSSVTETSSRAMSIGSRRNVRLESVEEVDECEASDKGSPVATEILSVPVPQAEDIKQVSSNASSVQGQRSLSDHRTDVPSPESNEMSDSIRTSDLPPMSLSSSTAGTSTSDSYVYAQWDVLSVRNPELLGAKRTLQRMDTAPVEWVGPLPSHITLKSLRGMKKSMSAVQYCLASAFVMFSSMSGIRFPVEVPASPDKDFPDGSREPSRSSISEGSINIRYLQALPVQCLFFQC